MKSKLYKSYKFHLDTVFGLYIGALVCILIAAYEYYSYVHLGASTEGFFDISAFSSIFFPCMLIGLSREKNKYLLANSITRKNVYISQILSMLSILPVIAIMIVAIEKIYYQADKYKPQISEVFSRYFKAHDVSQWGTIGLTILWVFGNIIIIFAILYMLLEVMVRLGKVGKIIFFVSIWIGFIALICSAAFLYNNNGSFIRKVFGFAGNPLHSTITKLIISIPFFISAYMLARRSPLKTK